MEWILEQQLLFDALYYYGSNRPIHISYAPQQRRNIGHLQAQEFKPERVLRNGLTQQNIKGLQQ